MNHGMKHRKLNRTSEHRKAMFANMACSIIKHKRIKTTLPKAKDLRPIVEKLVTAGKSGELRGYRQIVSFLKQDDMAQVLCKEIAPKYATRQGGYLRIIKCGIRHGDTAPMALIEFVEADGEDSKKKKTSGVKKASTKNTAKSTTKRATGKKTVNPEETTMVADDNAVDASMSNDAAAVDTAETVAKTDSVESAETTTEATN